MIEQIKQVQKQINDIYWMFDNTSYSTDDVERLNHLENKLIKLNEQLKGGCNETTPYQIQR
tara:strand:+ start:393 stop:575 length:183 start_codon:yes stop_codon:yes gene_type:complete